MSSGASRRNPRWLRRTPPRRVEPGSPYHVLFVCSSGGHLAQLVRLRPWWEGHERTWVTFRKPDAESALQGERVVWGHHPTTRNVANLGRNLALAVRLLLRERPDVIASNGAGIAVPFFWIGRILGCRTVYVEVYDRIDSAPMTSKLCRPVTDLFLVQWDQQRSLYPEAVVAGPVY